MFKHITRRCDKIALVMFYVLMADVCIFGAGKLVSIGPLTFRMILLLLTGLISLPVILENFSYLIKNKYTWILGGFCVWVIFSTFLGIKNHNAMNLILTDVKGFLYFALFPVSMCLLRTKHRVEILSKVMMYSSAVMGMIHIFCIIWYLLSPDSLMSYSADAFEKHFFYVSFVVSATNVRINFLSLVCLLFGCAVSVYYQVKERTVWKKYVYVLITAVCLFAIWLSYTRSVYLAAGVTAIGTVLSCLFRTDSTGKKRLIAHLCSSVAIFFVIIAVFQICTGTNYFQYGMSRVFVGTGISGSPQDGINTPGDPDNSDMTDTDATSEKTDTDVMLEEMDGLLSITIMSDDLRTRTVNDLMTNIGRSPIWGLGLGSAIPSRPDGLNEYFFLDLCSKTGLIGLLLYLGPVALMIWDLIKQFRIKNDEFCLLGIWLSVILGFVIYSYFTPCMNSSVGILCYCCAMGVFQQASINLSTKTK